MQAGTALGVSLHFSNAIAAMALLASLQFGDNDNKRYSKEYLVSDVRCHIQRQHNRFYADSNAKCERLEVTVVAPGKDDLTLIDWYVSQSLMTGRVVIAMSNDVKLDVSDSKEILFEDATCFGLNERYDIAGGRRIMTLSIAASAMTIDHVEFK